MDKSPDAFRTISEVAEDLDVPQHVLRFWESKFHQIKPLKRGGGRRYYRPADVDLLRGIKQLLYGDGYTIKGVKKILREQGVSYAQTIWGEQAGETGIQAPVTGHVQIPAATVQGTAEPSDEVAVSPVEVSRPAVRAVQGIGEDQSRLIKAALFELSEIRLLLESAPRKP